MRKTYIIYEESIYMRKKYGAMAFIFDIVMCVITAGLWLIWIFVREMRGR